jgi:hypothetical protein
MLPSIPRRFEAPIEPLDPPAPAAPRLLDGIPADRADWSLADWRARDAKGLKKLEADFPATYADLLGSSPA